MKLSRESEHEKLKTEAVKLTLGQWQAERKKFLKKMKKVLDKLLRK